MAKCKARVALSYVAFYQKHPERAGEHIPKCFDPAFQRFVMAKTLEEKRFTAKRHPELKALLDFLTEREALVIHALYWEDLTLVAVGERLGVTREAVRQIANRAVQKLKYHDRRQLERYKDQTRREDMVDALQQHSTLGEAALKLDLSPKEVLACLRRLENAPSVASPGREPGDDPRVEALKEASLPAARQRVATSYPELRPPHVFLNRDENRVLEVLYRQGVPYENARRELVWASGTRIREIEASALEKMAYYLQHQPVAYYKSERAGE